MAAILCLDFDDTVVLDNTARQVFERFADPAWREVEARYQRGELTVEQHNAACLDLIPVTVTAAELRAFAAETAHPREGFAELVEWAHGHGWQVVVVSNGFDFYVDPVLDRLGLDRVARHCGRTRLEYRWRVRYYSPRGIELQAHFKAAYAEAFRDAGDFVAYAGDGASDVTAARMAALVFARDTLLARLRGEHPRLYPFETFHDVVAVLEARAARHEA